MAMIPRPCSSRDATGDQITSSVCMSNNSWLSRTNQPWKLVISMVGGIVSLIMFLLLIWRINDGESLPVIPDDFTLVMLLVTIGGATFTWFLYGLKCPVCRKSIAVYVLNSAQANSWLTSLLSLTDCPFCRLSQRAKR